MNRPGRVALTHASVRVGGTAALTDFTGDFSPGTVTALIGGDGAGKSTLLRVLARRLQLSSGSIANLPPGRHTTGYQPADSGVWRNLSVAENVAFVAGVYGMDPTRARRRAATLLEIAGLTAATHRLAGQLSGGMRQKLGVILATLHEPSLVLLDEPTTGVDPVSRVDLWSLIAGAAADGATVVFATSYIDEAERAGNIFLLGAGAQLALGSPGEVIAGAPGSLAQAPAALPAARAELASPHAWRRGNTVFRWSPASDSTHPVGFTRAPGTLEDTSIALLLAHGLQRGQSLQHAPAARAATSAPRPTPAPGPVAVGAAVEATAVSRRYGSCAALHHVSLTVRPGEVVGLLGGNGAGKTTLMRILLGLDTATSGTATLFGDAPTLATRRRIGYVAQGLGLYPALTALENLEFAAAVHRTSVSEHDREFARSCGTSPVSALPLGTQRTIATVAATQHRPELLVLDEPTSGMDALARARLWRDLRAAADSGTAVLITTHYMGEAAQCDRLVCLTEGRITAQGTMAEITSGSTSLVVTTPHWQAAFALCRAARVQVLLDGRTLRTPGTSHARIREVLAPLGDTVRITETPATLEETMLLAELDVTAG